MTVPKDVREQLKLGAGDVVDFVVENDGCTRETPGWINRVVLCELVWVLESSYCYDRSQVADVVENLLKADDLVVEDSNHA